MRIAHLSDLHVLALDGVSAARFLNKRFTGWVNLKVKRAHVHRLEHVRAVMREIARLEVDHVVITGDLTNLALAEEFAAVRALLESELGSLGPNAISVVPGNHDVYTRGAMRDKRFTRVFRDYVTSDLPELAASLALGAFPFVRLRGPCAIIGLSSAVPRPPLVASGELGKLQLAALARIFDHPEVTQRVPVVLVHHPVHNPTSNVKTRVEGLWDADALSEQMVRAITPGLVLHGHLHVRRQKAIAAFGAANSSRFAIGATSASLHHENEHKMAGFNLYEVDADRVITRLEAHVLNAETGTFHIKALPLLT